MTYQANKGGHAPGHLREALTDYLETTDQETKTVEVDGEEKPLSWLIGQLWNCTDVMPASSCDCLDIHHGSTYAQAVRKLRNESER